MKRLGTLLSSIFLGGCSVLSNSGRASYEGPIVKPLWSLPNLAISKTPVIHDGIVYVQPILSGKTRLYAFDVKTGKQLWTSGFATEQIEVVIGPRVVVLDDQGLLHSLDAKSGHEIEPPEKTGLLSATADGNMLYALFKDRSVAAFDRPNHALWKAAVPMKSLFRPVAAGGNLYIYGIRLDAKDVRLGCGLHAFDAATGTLRWKWESDECTGTEDTPLSSLSADANSAYIRMDTATVDDKAGGVMAFDAATGKQKWTSPTVNFQTEGPILLDGSIVVVSDNIPGDHGGTAMRNNPYVLRGLDRATGQVKWESRTASKYETWTSAQGLLFVADRKAHALIGTGNATSPDSFLTVVDVRTGKELWRSETVQLGSFSVPAVGDGMVVVGSLPFGDENPQAGGLFAFPATRDGK